MLPLGLEPPTYGPRAPRPRGTDAFVPYLQERLAAHPGLTAIRLWRELRERGFTGGYTGVKRAVQALRPDPVQLFEVRFETPPGAQGQVDLARFEVTFTDEPGVRRVVWLFSLVLGCSRLIWAELAKVPAAQPLECQQRGASSCTRTSTRCCAATLPRSRRWVAHRVRSSTIA